MNINSVILVLYCIYLRVGSAAKLPHTFKRCKVSPELDKKPNECLKTAIEDAVVQLLSNDAHNDLKISDLHSLKFFKLVMEQGGKSSVAVKIKYTNNEWNGLKDVKVTSVSGKHSSPHGFNMVIEFIVPRLELLGFYSVNGKILILPIQGEGLSNITMMDVKMNTSILGESQTRNGKEYIKMTSLKCGVTISRLFVELQNLFNGNKLLGDNMNKFINENWKEIYIDMKPSIESAFGGIYESYVKRILERVQFKNIFITDS